jgi:hypothetical protein
MGITTIFGNFPISTNCSNGHFSSEMIFTTKNFRFLSKQAISAWNSAYQVERAMSGLKHVGLAKQQQLTLQWYYSSFKQLRLTYSDTHVLRYSRAQVLTESDKKLGASRDEALEHCTGSGVS